MESSTLEAAKAYWVLMKETFPQGSPTYTAFSQLLEAFTCRSITYATFLSTTKGFFRGHDHLIVQLENLFPSYENHPEKVEPRRSTRRNDSTSHHQTNGKNDSTSDFQDYGRPRKKGIWNIKNPIQRRSACRGFLSELRRRLNDDQIYRSFLDLMISYQSHKDLRLLDEKVQILFRETPEFHIEFTHFLVDAVEAEDIEKEKIRSRLNAGKDQVENPIKKRKRDEAQNQP